MPAAVGDGEKSSHMFLTQPGNSTVFSAAVIQPGLQIRCLLSPGHVFLPTVKNLTGNESM